VNSWGAVRLSFGVVLTVLGTALMVASLPAVVAAASIEASVGRSGEIVQPLGTLRAAEGDRAVLVDEVSARLILPAVHPWIASGLSLAGTDMASLAADVGTTILVVSPDADIDVFVGVAPADAVNDYLNGTPYSVAVQVDGDWPTISVPGDSIPAPPASVDLWTAAVTGSAPELPVEELDGTTLVLMRSDASPGVEAALRLEYRVPQAARAVQSAAVAAAALSIGGLLIILLGARLVVGRRTVAASLE
jgi:hypothetical protein